jgi:hypothetical protein
MMTTVYLIKANDSVERVVDNPAFAEGFVEGAATVEKERQSRHGGAHIRWHIEQHELEQHG